MYLPQELYVYLFKYADDVKTTKILRSVCKVAYKASYDYFNILLKTPIIVKCNREEWFLGKNTHIDDPYDTFCPLIPGNKISFEINTKALFNSINNNKKGTTIDFNNSTNRRI